MLCFDSTSLRMMFLSFCNVKSSVSLDMGKPIMVHYADANTELSGYTCSDTIGLGGYRSGKALASLLACAVR